MVLQNKKFFFSLAALVVSGFLVWPAAAITGTQWVELAKWLGLFYLGAQGITDVAAIRKQTGV